MNEDVRRRLKDSLFEKTVDGVINELRRRQATVHERVRCPTCSAPVGVRCRSMPRGWRPLDLPGRKDARELKSAHKARLRADGLYER